MPGDISREYTVWCGRCSIWLQLPGSGGKQMFRKEIRQNGWSLNKDHGWLCPECVTEVKNGQEEVGYRHQKSDRG